MPIPNDPSVAHAPASLARPGRRTPTDVPERAAARVVLPAAALFLLAWLLPVPEGLIGRGAFLPLHTLMETFAVVVSMLVFGIGWAARATPQTAATVTLTATFLAVGLLDFAHMMSYPGMPDFVTPADPRKATVFWLAARGTAALGLLGAVLLLPRPGGHRLAPHGTVAVALLATGALYWIGLYHERALPAMFIAVLGLTPFKIGAEYLVIVVHLATVAVLIARRRTAPPFDTGRLLAAVAVLALGELCFTLPAAASDLLDILGHFYKIVAYGLVGQALFADTVRRPYLRLAESEEALRESEARHHQLVEMSPDAVAVHDLDGRIRFANRAAAALLGARDAAQLIDRSIMDFIHPDHRAVVTGRIRQALATRESAPPNEELLVRLDGTPVRVETTGAVISFHGQPAVQVIARDVEQRKRVHEMTRLLSSVVQQMPGSVMVTGRGGVIEYVNPAFEAVTGYTAAEAIGRKPNLVKSGEHPPEFYRRLWQTILAGETFRAVLTNRRKDGALYYEDKTITPVRDERGEITHFVSTGKNISDQVRAERALQESEERFRRLTELSSDWIWEQDEELRFTSLSDGITKGGVRAASLVGKHRWDMPIDWAPGQLEQHRATLEAHQPFHDFEYRVLGEGGPQDWHWFSISGEPQFDAAGRFRGYRGVGKDITERKRAALALHESEARFRSLTELSSDWYWEQDENLRFTTVTRRAEADARFPPEDHFGKTRWELPYLDVAPEVWVEHQRTLAERRPFRDLILKRRDRQGRVRYSSISGEPVFDAEGRFRGYRGIGRDITERVMADEQLSQLAYYDSLTGLPNRALLRDRLHQTMMEAERQQRLVAILFMDLDRFKFINDSLGHAAGDALLKSVAERLRACVRSGDTIARLGGDEFTIVLAGIEHIDHVALIAQKLLDQFAAPFFIGGNELYTNASIGVTLYPWDDSDIDTLLKNADAAMYHAKESGRGTFQFYTAELNQRARRRLELETSLRQALERREFTLHYQPMVDLATGRIAGAEALLRWLRPGHGLVPPMEFIPLAEDTGLILPIGEWALRTACAQARAWARAGFPDLRLAVNLSGRQLTKDLPRLVREVLEETRLPPGQLDLELTESLLMRDLDSTATLMNDLHALGVSCSMDDFGTGYSSLSYLKRFPIDHLKVDRSFVRDVPHDPDDTAITRAIIAMAHTMDIKVVAEGVETREQFEFLRAQGCDLIQGYYCSAPLPAEEFAALLQRWQPRALAPEGGGVRRKP